MFCFDVQKIRDVSGQSFVSPPPSVLPGHKDAQLQTVYFDRTKEEDQQIGYFPGLQNELAEADENVDGEVINFADEVLQFPTQCNGCGKDCQTKMKLTKIPHFKEVVIMATDCDHCGERSTEVKSGGGIEKKGRRISLKVTSVDDLCRDVLKASGNFFQLCILFLSPEGRSTNCVTSILLSLSSV